MDVSKNKGIPKWMVKIMVPNPIKLDDLGGNTPIFGLTPICSTCHKTREPSGHKLRSHDGVIR